jgi:hypothetical protein
VEWLRSRLAAIPSRHDVSVRIETPAERVRSLVGQWATVEEIGGGASRMRMSVDDLAWPVFIIGTLGAPFTIESPPQLVEAVRSVGETLLRGSAA